jgi:hypothetical protein
MTTSLVLGIAAGLLVSYSSNAQRAISTEVRSQIAMDQISRGAASNGANIVYGLAAPPGEVIGDVYIDPAWNMGTAVLGSGVLIERYNMRYDLKTQVLEIQTFSDIKLLDARMLKTIVWRDAKDTRYFVTGSTYKLEGQKVAGVLEVLVDGAKPLLRRPTLYVKRPDYVPAMDVGSRDATIYKKTALFHVVGTDLVELKGKKAVMAALSDKGPEIEAFIKTNKLGTKSDEDVTAIFEYYNELVEK